MNERYAPTSNKVRNHYKFHRITQNTSETFDDFTHRVKAEAVLCDFKCTNENCMVQNTLIREQIIVGTCNEAIREDALKNQWDLANLTQNGHTMESSQLHLQKSMSIKLANIPKGLKILNETQKQNLPAGNAKKNLAQAMTSVNIVIKSVQNAESMHMPQTLVSVKVEGKVEKKSIAEEGINAKMQTEQKQPPHHKRVHIVTPIQVIQSTLFQPQACLIVTQNQYILLSKTKRRDILKSLH